MTQFGIVALYAVGMALVVLEIILPGVVLGIIGLAMMLAGVVLGFQSTAALGWTLVGITVVSMPVLGLLWSHFLRRKLAIKMTQEGYTSAQVQLKELVGHEGVALTALRPAGMARIGDLKVDVVAEAEMIDRGARVAIVEVRGNRVVVKQVRG